MRKRVPIFLVSFCNSYPLKKNILLAHIAVFMTALIYAINFSVAKDVMPKYLSPFVFILLRVSFAFICFLCLYLFLFYERIEKADIKQFILCGFFGTALNQLLFFKGLSLTTPINGALLMLTTPILVVLFSAILIKEKITWQKIVGITVGISGASILILNKPIQTVQAENASLGNILIVLNAASYALALVFMKPLAKKYQPTTISMMMFATALPIVSVVAWSEIGAVTWAFPTKIWLEIGFVLFFVTFIVYLLNGVGLKYLSPATVSGYIYLQPVLTSLIAISLGTDFFTPIAILAGIMICTGIYIMNQ